MLVKGRQVWSEPRAKSIPGSKCFEWSKLIYLLLKNNQASSTDGMRSVSFQDTLARSIRNACSLKCFRELLAVMGGGCLTADRLRTEAMRQ